MSTDRLFPIAETALNHVVSLAMESGNFDRVNQHEAKSAPGTGVTFAVWVQEVKPLALQSGLDVTSARLLLQTRVYQSMLAEPADMIDINMVRAVSWMQAQYVGDFDIGGTTWLDVQGAYGIDITARSGYINLDGKLMRISDTQLPFICPDVWTQEA
jgi:hypothetical protein